MQRVLYGLICIALIQTGIFAQSDTQTKSQACPSLSLECPHDLVEGPFGPVTFTAIVTGGDPNFKPTFKWSVAEGEIVTGQGTPTVTIRNSKGGSVFTATVELIGLPERCGNTASCSVIYEHPPRGRKFDEYGKLAFRDEKPRLVNFAIELYNNPGSQGYIVAFGGRRDRSPARLNRARTYLIDGNGIEPGRIVTIQGGHRGKQRFELWIVPVGALGPTREP